MLDFSNEEQQKEPVYGPVPSGSIVIVEMNVLEPNRYANDNRLIALAQSGLRQIYCQFAVDRGEYAGVRWRQNITLPASMQNIELLPRQRTACRIGGATLKAILEAAKKRTAIQSLAEFISLKFPVRVKLNKQPYISENGAEYWRNEIATVITPDMKPYQQAQREGEIINPDGLVSGARQNGGQQPQTGDSEPRREYEDYSQESAPVDEVPF